MAELVRILHTLTPIEAAEIVETLVEREVNLVWRHRDTKRVLKPGLTWKQNALLLLLSEPGEISESSLVAWIEHTSVASFRRDVLRPGHKSRLWEYNQVSGTIRLLPPGIDAAEELLRKLRS